MTSSNGNIFRVTCHFCGEFTGHRWIPCTSQWRGTLMFSFICSLNKRLNKQSSGWWFETTSRSLWRYCYGWNRCQELCTRIVLCRIWLWVGFGVLSIYSSGSLLWPWGKYSISQEICTRFCCALLCCGYAIVHHEFTWSIYPYSSGLLCWHWGNR